MNFKLPGITRRGPSPDAIPAGLGALLGPAALALLAGQDAAPAGGPPMADPDAPLEGTETPGAPDDADAVLPPPTIRRRPVR